MNEMKPIADYSAERERDRAESRRLHKIDMRLALFAQILQSQPTISPKEAAALASQVYDSLSVVE